MTINTQKLLAAHGSIAPLSPMRLERLEARALQQLDYSGPGSRGKSIYVGANEVLELVSAARALTDAQAVFDAQTAEMARLREQIKDMDVVGLAYEQRDLPSLFGGPGSPNSALAQEGS